MKVKVRKRKTSVLGSPLFKGTQLEISEEKYNMYQDEFDLVEKTKPKLEKSKNKSKPELIEGLDE